MSTRVRFPEPFREHKQTAKVTEKCLGIRPAFAYGQGEGHVSSCSFFSTTGRIFLKRWLITLIGTNCTYSTWRFLFRMRHTAEVPTIVSHLLFTGGDSWWTFSPLVSLHCSSAAKPLALPTVSLRPQGPRLPGQVLSRPLYAPTML